jgi:hypothetical protein
LYAARDTKATATIAAIPIPAYAPVGNPLPPGLLAVPDAGPGIGLWPPGPIGAGVGLLRSFVAAAALPAGADGELLVPDGRADEP